MPLDVKTLYTDVRDQLRRVVFGQDETIDLLLAGLFSSGHVLLEGMPGTAKTLLVRALAASLDLSFGRVQMTPDLLPNDITGSSVYHDDTQTFQFHHGPIFTHFLLADEINRASAKTQSALLEAMQELTVTQESTSHRLPAPFMVFATQNPAEQEGVYPLPLAQLDRFMMKIRVSYPDPACEEAIYREHHATRPYQELRELGIEPKMGAEEVLEAREIIRRTFVRDEVVGYVRRLIQATRQEESITVGASPRAGLMLLMVAKSRARFEGRDFLTPDDIKGAVGPVLCHRIVLSAAAELEGATPDEVLLDLIESIEVPR